MRALRMLQSLQIEKPCIVEIGTIRDNRETALDGDGWSTVAWGWYASETGGRAVTTLVIALVFFYALPLIIIVLAAAAILIAAIVLEYTP